MQPQTAFITILRDPASHFEVAFRNLEFAEILEMKDLPHPYLMFLENPRKYIGRTIQRKRFKVGCGQNAHSLAQLFHVKAL